MVSALSYGVCTLRARVHLKTLSSLLNLFLHMVPSSSEDVARALRGQPGLSRNCLRRNGGNAIVVVSISFHGRDYFSAFSRPFVRLGFRLLFTR